MGRPSDLAALAVSLSAMSCQCRLVKSGANLLLQPYNGNRLMINGIAQTIPSSGVSFAATGLTAGTTYFIYAYMNGSTMALEASTTGHSADTATGMEVKTGDSSRTLVGMARPVLARRGRMTSSSGWSYRGSIGAAWACSMALEPER